MPIVRSRISIWGMMIWRFTRFEFVCSEVTTYIIKFAMGIVGVRIGRLKRRTHFYCFERDEDNTRYKCYLAYHHWNAFQGWLVNHSKAGENFNQFKVSVMINHDLSFFFRKLTHLFFGKKVAYCQLVQAGRASGVFPMRDRRLWEGVFAANENGAVRTEVAMEPEIAAMAIANPEVVAEPGMGSVRQSKHPCE